jgi:hypothetical protein
MKHNASNTPVLAEVKKIFNNKIYNRALGIYNAQGRGAALEYLQQFTTRHIDFLLGLR